MLDEIHIRGLDLPTLIGVPEEERAQWQTLQADITLGLSQKFEAIGDDLSLTIDYSVVATRLRGVAAARPRRLLETLAAEMAALVLSEFQAATVTLELRKRILPGTDHVAVRIVRAAAAG